MKAEQSECYETYIHNGRGRQFIPSQRTQSTVMAHFRKRQTIGVRNFWCESNVVAKGVCVPLGRLSVPQRDGCGGASLKWKCQNPKFSDIKAIPRAAHPVATPRSAPRDCAATVTQINKSENVKTILGWLAGWLVG